MSQENVEATRRLLAVFNRREKDAWVAASDPEIENVPSREWPETAPVRGTEAVWDFLVEVTETWDGVDFKWGALLDAGRDKVVANQRAETRGKTSGAGVGWSFWVVLTFRDGKVLRLEWFADRTEAFEVVGLAE